MELRINHVRIDRSRPVVENSIILGPSYIGDIVVTIGLPKVPCICKTSLCTFMFAHRCHFYRDKNATNPEEKRNMFAIFYLSGNVHRGRERGRAQVEVY